MEVTSAQAAATNEYSRKAKEQSFSAAMKLGKDEFLQLLVTQLRYQDPLSPMNDRQFIAQLANFSTLEQMMNIRQLLESVVGRISTEGNWLVYSEFIGKHVTYDVGGETSEGASGTVNAVTKNENGIFLEMEDGTIIPLESVYRVAENDDHTMTEGV